jgi:hypothetical protein
MSHNFQGISEEQENDCRAALQTFVEKHGLFDWEMTLKVQEATPGHHSVKIEITPPQSTGLARRLPQPEIAVTGPSMDISADVSQLLELAYLGYFPEPKKTRGTSHDASHL